MPVAADIQSKLNQSAACVQRPLNQEKTRTIPVKNQCGILFRLENVKPDLNITLRKKSILDVSTSRYFRSRARSSRTAAGYATRNVHHQTNTALFTMTANGKNDPRNSASDPAHAATPVSTIVLGWHHPGFVVYAVRASPTTWLRLRRRAALLLDGPMRSTSATRAGERAVCTRGAWRAVRREGNPSCRTRDADQLLGDRNAIERDRQMPGPRLRSGCFEDD
jgi:hypothetical protein